MVVYVAYFGLYVNRLVTVQQEQVMQLNSWID